MRLIDADKLIADLYDEQKHSHLMAPFKLCTADRVDLKFLLNEAPTIDAALVVHGHWNITEYEYFDCSVCGDSYYTGAESSAQARSYLNSGHFYRYCPNCGAKMDGGKYGAAT